MLHAITSNLPEFADVRFSPGVNFVIAKGTANPTRDGSANSVGKSSLFFLIDYLLGGQFNATVFKSDLFAGASFTLHATLGGRRVRITREVDPKNRNYVIVEGDIVGWLCSENEGFGIIEPLCKLSIEDWRHALGAQLFELPIMLANSFSKEPTIPSARNLLNFFNRKDFKSVIKPYEKATEDEGNLICSYLMGLNWIYQAESMGLNKEENVALGLDSSAEYELKRIQLSKKNVLERMKLLKSQIEAAERELANFGVVEHNKLFMERLDEVTADLRVAQRRATNARRRIALATDSKKGISDDVSELEEFYKEAGFELGDKIRHTLEEVRNFHSKVRDYRVSILEKEIAHYRQELEEAESDIAKLSSDRQNCIQVDEDAKKTFADFHDKQTRLAKLREEVMDIENIEKLREHAAEEKKRVGEAREKLVEREKAAFAKCRERIAGAKEEYCSAMNDLYGVGVAKPSFEVSFLDGKVQKGSKKPYAIRIKASIEGDDGRGKKQVNVCIFDILMYKLNRMVGRQMDFLIHDTPIFESSDKNQHPGMILKAAEVMQEQGGQYICALDETRLNLVRAENADFDTLFKKSGKIILTQEHKLFGFSY